MISTRLFKHEIKGAAKIFIIFAAILTMYFGVIVYMFDEEQAATLQQLANTMPELMNMFGMGASANTLIGTIANYLYGMLMPLLPAIFTIILANRVAVRHVDRGSMAYLLASPNTRRKIITTQALTVAVSSFALILWSTASGIIFSEAMFPGKLDISRFLILNACTFALQLAIAGFCFMVSCICNDSGKYFLITSGFLGIEYLIQMLSNMGDKLDVMKYCTFFTLFDAMSIADGSVRAAAMSAVLAAAGIVFFVFGAYRFCKKDMPV